VSRNGAELPLQGPGLMRSRYSTGSRGGVSVDGFTAPVRGAYAVTVKLDSPAEGAVVVGRSIGVFGVVKIVLGCLAFLGIGVGGGVFLIARSLRAIPPPP
jgi:hypothetical protein